MLEGPNNLKFSLDESVSVSAAISPTTPGTASAPLTADNIGPEYNLAKDETLKVSNYPKSEIDAIADSDFSGGSSREVSSVSQSDVDELRASLTDELEDEAREKITNVLTVDEVYIEGTTLSAETDSNVSNKVGDEAGNIELSLELEVSVLIVRRSDLDSLASRLLENETPQGFLFRKEQVDKVFKLESQSGGTYKIAIDFEANLLPDLDIDEIKNKISGKYPEVASDYLQTVPGFKKAEIRINPRFPGKFGTLPKVKSNISIEISASK
ncbi:MAG: hypothetical protein ACD_52C00118G0006 [uncultured bacterium]|nr:MAG: hypothetical protein ACD_52C00118G0006 [uncultured bacterium]